MQSNYVRVVARVRPLVNSELSNLENTIFDFPNSQSCSVGSHTFSFDRVFTPEASQEEVFHTHFNENVDNVLDGFNSTIIAFGQTAAGKSFTMTGGQTLETEGVIPRTIRRIFDNQKNGLTATYVEIHNEKVKDLLNNRSLVTMLGDGSLKGVITVKTNSAPEALKVIKRANLLRATSCTKMNDTSSRSHAILSLQLATGAKLVLVDLAGSEVVKKTGACGQALEEAGSINKSLTDLSMVISALSKQNLVRPTFIPYRNSKLTQILQDAFGGNSKTSLIINCSPSPTHLAETVSSLRFGTRSKSIKNTIPNKEDRAILCAILPWQHRIDREIQLWKLGQAPARSRWLDLNEPCAIIEKESSFESASMLMADVHYEEFNETELDSTVDVSEHPEVRNLESSIIQAKNRIAELESRIGDTKCLCINECGTQEPFEIVDQQRRLSGLNTKLNTLSMTTESLRRDLAEVRAQPIAVKVSSYIKQLDSEILECYRQLVPQTATYHNRPDAEPVSIIKSKRTKYN